MRPARPPGYWPWSQFWSQLRVSGGSIASVSSRCCAWSGARGRRRTDRNTPPRRAPASSLQHVQVRAWSHRRWQAQAAGSAERVVALRKRRSAIRRASKARYAPFPDRTAGLQNVTELAFCRRTDSSGSRTGFGVVRRLWCGTRLAARCGIVAGWACGHRSSRSAAQPDLSAPARRSHVDSQCNLGEPQAIGRAAA
jgi:hypothetical protein